MKKIRRLISVFLALAMIFTSVNMEGFTLTVKAEEKTTGPYYMGVMITEAEFNELTCSGDYVNQDEFEDFGERYRTWQDSVDEVLVNLKQADFYQEEVGKTAASTSYFLITVIATDATPENVTALDGVSGVVFTSGGYKELDRDDYSSDEEYETEVLQNEDYPWISYSYPDMEIEVEAPVTFLRSYHKNITLNYVEQHNVLFQETRAEGMLSATAASEGSRTVFFGSEVWLYGIENIDVSEFIVGRDGFRGLRFNSASGDEPIQFKKIEAARADIATGVLTSGVTDNSDRINLDIKWHEGKDYYPIFAGEAELGYSFWMVEYESEIYNVWRWWDEADENKEHRYLDMGNGFYEADIDDQGVVQSVESDPIDAEMEKELSSTEAKNQVGIAYYDSFWTENEDAVRHEPQAGEKVLSYANSLAWGSGNYWCDGTEAHGEYRADVDGTLFDEQKASMWVEAYENQSSYEVDYHRDGECNAEEVCRSGSIDSVLLAMSYYQELHSDKQYYKVSLKTGWDESGQPLTTEMNLGDIIVPSNVKGIRFEADGLGEGRNIVGVIDSITVGDEQSVELLRSYQAANDVITINGIGTLSLWDGATVTGDIVMKDDGTITMARSSVNGNVSTYPANGSIGTLQMYERNDVSGLNGWEKLEYGNNAEIFMVDYQGIDLYEISNGYDGQDDATANGHLNFRIQGLPAEGTEPTFHKKMELGEETEGFWYRADDAGEHEEYSWYPVYHYDVKIKEGTDDEPEEWVNALYAKMEDVYHELEDGENGRTLTGYILDGVTDADIINILEQNGPSKGENCVYFEFMNDVTLEDWGGAPDNLIEVPLGTKLVNFACDTAAEMKEIWQTVKYDRFGEQWIDLDGCIFNPQAEDIIYISKYTEENGVTAEESFLNDRWDGETYNEQVARSGSLAGVELWLDALSTDGLEYLKLEVNKPDLDFGEFVLAESLKGLFVQTGSYHDEADNQMQSVAEITSITASQNGQQVKLSGEFSGFTFEKANKEDVKLSLLDANINGDVVTKEDSTVAIRNTSVAGSVSTSPADGSIGTLQLYNNNSINGLLGWKQLDYEHAQVDMRDYQGIDLYEISNGYDGDEEHAQGNLEFQIWDVPSETEVPTFHKAMELGQNDNMTWYDTDDDGEEEGYTLYRYDVDDENYELYAKVGDDFYLVDEPNNRAITEVMLDETDDAAKIAELENAGPWKYDCNVRLRFFDEGNEMINVPVGTKIVNLDGATALEVKQIWQSFWYDDFGLGLDLDGRLFDQRSPENIRVMVYDGETSFQNDYEGEANCSEDYNTGSAEGTRLWLEALAEEGEAYLKVEACKNDVSLGDIVMPTTLKGLCLATASYWDEDLEIDKLYQMDITSITASDDDQQVKLYGAFSGFAFDKGDTNAELILQNAKIQGTVAASGVEVSVRQQSVVTSLENVGIMNLLDCLTVDNKLSFADDGKLNANVENTNPRIFARSGAVVEIPDVDAIYDSGEGYANYLEIAEEIKNGVSPVIRFTGDSLAMGSFWNTFGFGAYNVNDNEDRAGFSFRRYYKDNSALEQPDERDLIEIEGTVYQVVWGGDIDAANDLDEIEIDGKTWKIDDSNTRLRETSYSTTDLLREINNNQITLVPYDYDKMSVDSNANVIKDMYIDRNYSADLDGAWNMEYSDGAISEYYMSNATTADENNFKKIVVQYGKQDGAEFKNRCINLYPVKQYRMDNPDDPEFTDDDISTEDVLLLKYAMYAINYEDWTENDNGVRTSNHYIKSSINGRDDVALDSADVSITFGDETYTGSAIEAKPVVEYTDASGTTTLEEGTHYTLSDYTENTDVGEASVVVTAVPDSGFTGSKTVNFNIIQKALTNAMVAAIPNQTYTGGSLTPVITVTHDSQTLVKDTDYTVSAGNWINAGTHTITITGTGNYSGSVSVNFTITPKTITGNDAANIASQAYTGSKLEPAVTVTSGGKVLTKNTDYTIVYAKNLDVGTATATITGKGNYTGSFTKNFTINSIAASKLTVATISNQYYTGKAIVPALSVKYGSLTLKKDTDYTVAVKNNKNIGKATVTITGKGNYTGSTTKTFQITVKNSANYTVGDYKYQITNAAVNGKGTVAVTGPAKKTLKTIKIADTVTIGGVKFKITEISKNAFKSCTKATSITIGNNVTKIGDNAFAKCTAVTKATIGKGVKQIGVSVFEGAGKLKTITINTSSLTKVGKNALKGINKKATIKVPKAKLSAYQKLLKSKGQASTVKIKK